MHGGVGQSKAAGRAHPQSLEAQARGTCPEAELSAPLAAERSRRNPRTLRYFHCAKPNMNPLREEESHAFKRPAHLAGQVCCKWNHSWWGTQGGELKTGGWGKGGVGGQGCIRREGTSEAAPEAVKQAVGGGCRSGWGRLLSVTNAIEAGTWRQGDSGWAQAGGAGWGDLPPFQCIPGEGFVPLFLTPPKGSSGSAPTSCLMSRTVHHCPCVSDTVARCGTCSGYHCWRASADSPLTALCRASVPPWSGPCIGMVVWVGGCACAWGMCWAGLGSPGACGGHVAPGPTPRSGPSTNTVVFACVHGDGETSLPPPWGSMGWDGRMPNPRQAHSPTDPVQRLPVPEAALRWTRSHMNHHRPSLRPGGAGGGGVP